VTTLEYAPGRLQFELLGENDQVRRSRAFLALMRQRRSVRHFSSEPGAPELIETAVRAAATAPSAFRTSGATGLPLPAADAAFACR
jgi:hypothetical protein